MWIVADLALVSQTAVACMALRLLILIVPSGCRVLSRVTSTSLQGVGCGGLVTYLGERLPESWLGLYPRLFDNGFFPLGTSDARRSSALPEACWWLPEGAAACLRPVAALGRAPGRAPGRALPKHLVISCSARRTPLTGRRQGGPLTSEDAQVLQDCQRMLRYAWWARTVRRSRAPASEVVLSLSC
jgi:hypothetical protein